MIQKLKHLLLSQEFWFGQLNSRPLSLFRIGFGFILLKEALFHLPLANVFYSDAGVVPRHVVWEMIGQRFSLMNALPDMWMAQGFFIGWAIIALCVLVGFQTRFFCVLNFVIVLSVYERNPLVVNGADDILRLLSFWVMFIPLHHFYSVDAIRARNKINHRTGLGTTYAFPVRFIQVQIALIYLGAGIFKIMGEQWRDGIALFYVLQLDSWLLPMGKWLGANGPDWLLRLITYQVVIIEIAFPILVFIPLGQPTLRRLGLVLVGTMHLGIALMTPLIDFLLVLGGSYLLFFSQAVRAAPAAQDPVNARKPAFQGVTSVFLAVLMVFILWENADNFRWHNAPIIPSMPSAIASILDLAGLHQAWDLFSPNPVQLDWVIAAPATFADGTSLDLRTGQPFRMELRQTQLGPAYRWKQLEFIASQNRPVALLKAWAEYYCRLYDGAAASPPTPQLTSVQIEMLYRYSHAPGQALNPIQKDLLWISTCN